MRKITFLAVLFLFSGIGANAQTGEIVTIAGTGTGSFSGDGGQATVATMNYPEGICLDASGNVYFDDYYNNRVREVNMTTGIITTIAGNGSGGFSGDGGAATAAELNTPTGVAVDASGNVYIADWANSRIRLVSHATGIITTIAGTGSAGYNGDNIQATAAKLNSPDGIVLDATNSNLYIGDLLNMRVRKVNLATGIITTIAGNGSSGYSGNGGQATAAELNGPRGVALDDSNNVYVCDWANSEVRKINALTGVITAVAGTGSNGYSGDNGPSTSAKLYQPRGVAVDNLGNVYIGDGGNNRIREVIKATGTIVTICGTGTAGYTGDGGQATAAEVGNIAGLVLDASRNLFMVDQSYNVVREIKGPLAVQQVVNSINLNAYPNPVSSNLNLKISGSVAGNYSVSVTDITGREIITEQKRLESDGLVNINMSAFPTGVYFARVTLNDGFAVVKFIKE